MQGSQLFQGEGKAAVVLKEIDSFYEPKNTNILHFEKAAKDQPMTIIACYLEEGDEENVKMIR